MRAASRSGRPVGDGPPGDVQFDLPGLGAALWRKKWKIVGPTLIVALATLAAVQVVTPKYLSEARVLIEGRDNVYLRPAADKDLVDRNLVDDQTVTTIVPPQDDDVEYDYTTVENIPLRRHRRHIVVEQQPQGILDRWFGRPRRSYYPGYRGYRPGAPRAPFIPRPGAPRPGVPAPPPPRVNVARPNAPPPSRTGVIQGEDDLDGGCEVHEDPNEGWS